MAFRSPWDAIAEALPRIGQALSQGIQTAAQQRQQEEQQFRQSQQGYRNAITEQLANPDLTSEDAQRLRRQLQLVNESKSIDDLDALGQQLEATQLMPGERPSLEALFSPTTGVATSTQGEIARAARGSAVAGREREEALAAYQDARSVLSATDVDPNVKSQFLDSFLASGAFDALPDAQKRTLAALSNYADPAALEERSVALREGRARAGLAEEQLETVQATQAQAIDAALAEYRVTIETADDLVAQAGLRTRDLEEGIDQRAESHAQNMELGEERLTLLQDQIKQGRQAAGRAETAFDVDMAEADLRAIQAAIDMGTDGHLNDRQKQGLADYFGTEVGSQEYVSVLEKQRNNYLAAVEGQLRAEALAGDRAAAALAMDEQQLKTSQLQFDVTQYQFDRAQRMDPLEDARVFQASLAEATWAGDTQTVQRYLTILENPDMAPEEAEALKEMGYTVEGLRDALSLAEGERERISEDRDLRIQVAREQVTALENENNVSAIGILDEVSQFYQTPEEVEADRARLTQGRGGLTNDEVDLIKSKVAVRYGLFTENEAAKKLDTFSQVPPTREGETAWASSFVGLAMESGYSRPEAEAMAEGFINAYRLDDRGTRAQIRLAEMRADELERALNAPDADPDVLGVTTSEFLSGLRLQESTIERQQAMNGCLPPSTIGDIIVNEAIASEAIAYWNEHQGDSDTCRALAQDTQDIAALTARVTGWVPSGGTTQETPSGTTTPTPSAETGSTEPETRTVFTPVTGAQTVSVNGQSVSIPAQDMAMFNELARAITIGNEQDIAAYGDMLNDAGYADNVIQEALNSLYGGR